MLLFFNGIFLQASRFRFDFTIQAAASDQIVILNHKYNMSQKR